MSRPVKYSGLSETRRRYTTVESWRSYVNAKEPPRPRLATESEKGLWTPTDRETYDAARRRFHRQFDPLMTPDMREAHRQILHQAWENLDSGYGAKPGGAVDGEATLGKTTVVAELGKRFELRLLRKHPVEDPGQAHLAIPVVYVTLPPRATPKTLNVNLARFLNVLLPRKLHGVTADDLSDAIARAVELHGTQMIIVDDLNYVQLKDRNQFRLEEAQIANNHLKFLANILDVSFVYAGINLEQSGLFDEGALLGDAAAQTGGRFIQCRMHRFENGKEAWFGLLDGLEKKLSLERLEPGTLRAHGSYLYRRSQGSSGVVVNLIRKAANLAVGRSETISESLLEQTKLPRNAEFHSERLRSEQAGGNGT